MKQRRAGKFAAVFAAALLFTVFTVKEAKAEETTLVEAETAAELVEAMADNTTIVLAPGTYNLTEYLRETDEVKDHQTDQKDPGVYRTGGADEPEILISGLQNLTIVSADPKNPAEIVCEPRHADVLAFTDCENILLDGLVIGHTPDPGYCSGDVVSFMDSEHITIAGSELYGCGAYALELISCEYVTMMDCDVHDCTYGCVTGRDNDRIDFIHTDFHDCREFTMFELGQDGAASLIGCSLKNLEGTLTDTSRLDMIGLEIDNCFDGFGGADFGGPETEPEAEPEKEPEKPEAEPEKEPTLLNYTVEKRSFELMDEDTRLGISNFNEICLSEEDQEAYPALWEVLSEQNSLREDEAKFFLQDNEADILELQANAGDIYYDELDETYIPERADGSIFSYALSEYNYLGGAHGVTFYHCFNIDPQTGSSIALSDVVKNIDDLPAVVLSELKADKDYAEYYEDNEEGENTFFDTMETYLDNDAALLLWTLDYEGMHVYFNDYEIGPYVMGAPCAFVAFSDHPELFNEDYIYGGEVPKDDNNMVFTDSSEDPVILASQNHGAKLLPLYWGSAPFWPEDEADYGDGYSYSTNTDLYEVDEEAWPELAKTLDRMNDEKKKTYGELLPLFKKEIDSNYEKKDEDGPWESFCRESVYSLCRADDRVLSFVQYDNFTGIGDKEDPASYATGINLDPKTGKHIDLLDVVTSKRSLTEAFEKELSETNLYVDDWKDTVTKLLDAALTDDEIISGAQSGLSFTFDYNGLTLYFNGEDTGYDDGPCSILLSYAEYPELFEEAYTVAPMNYCSELMTGKFEYVYWYDFDGDDEAEPFSLVKEPAEWEDWDQFVLHWNGTSTELTDAGPFFYANAFLIHDMDQNFLYIEATTENDYQTVHVYEITKDGLEYKGSTGGSIKYNTYPDDEDEPIGYLPVNPRSFRMVTMDDTLGTNFLTGEYSTGFEGIPLQNSWYLDYTNTDYWSIKTVEDIDAQYHVEDDFSTGYQDGTLKAGTDVLLYQKGQDGDLLLKTKDGKIWWLELEKQEDGYGFTYQGKDLDDLFEGQVYAG
ncbi:MAG: DUF3298 domain-containing protein [Lachnospiraceae bacterium]|nr:DUF3298 domain-containing protein [Lachnospiraceae bacterium]